MNLKFFTLFLLLINLNGCPSSVKNTVEPGPSSTPQISSNPSVNPSLSVAPTTNPTPVILPSLIPTAVPTAEDNTNTAGQNCLNISLIAGQKITATEFFSLVCIPAVKIGTKWLYSNSNFDVSNEIIAKDTDGTFTMIVKTGTPATVKEIRSKNPTGNTENIDNTTVIFEGTETITVPAGTFTAYKGVLTRTESGNPQKLTYWVNKSIGTLKVRTDALAGGLGFSSEIVLKEFKN
jgi:hypothetical protein